MLNISISFYIISLQKKNIMNITQPTLILDKEKCLHNIDLMLAKIKDTKLILRPHFKTHQSAIIGEWFREKGIDKISVSSIKMAKYFALHGWKDISVCMPVNILEIDDINTLSAEINLNILVESIEIIEFLHKNIKGKVNIFIKIDTAYKRTGIDARNIDYLQLLCLNIKSSDKLNFKGFISHSGHNYKAESTGEIQENNKEAIVALNELKYVFTKDFPDAIISLGDTPGCSICDNFPGIDELRPGNFVFYDMKQYVLGSCNEEQIAVAMACPVIAKHSSRNELVIYGGGIHFSKEYIEADDQGNKLFGSIVNFENNKWGEILPGAYLSDLSQEHGIIKCNDDMFNKYNPGDIIYILPIHSCMTANLMGRFLTTNDEWISMMPKF